MRVHTLKCMKRSRMDILADILYVLSGRPKIITQAFHEANIDGAMSRISLGHLMKYDLVTETQTHGRCNANCKGYMVTEKGRELLKKYEEFVEGMGLISHEQLKQLG